MNKKIAYVILAGGKGKRLGGVVKANIKVGGISLLSHIKTSLQKSNAIKLISIGAMNEENFDLSDDWVAIKDQSDDQKGPLAGIAASIEYLQKNNIKADYLFSLAVDGIFFPDSFCDLALDILDDETDAIVAKYNGQTYPTNAIWRVSSIDKLPKRIEKLSAFGIKGLLNSLSIKEIELNEHFNDNICKNINEISDIIACEKLINSKKNKQIH